MEIQHPILSLRVTLLLLTFLFIVIRRLAGSASKKGLPPGPRKLPLLGNIHQLLGGLPHHILRDLAAKHGPDLMLLRLGQIDQLVVSSAEAAREIMKTHDLNFCSRPRLLAPTIMCYGNVDIGFAPYGSYWRQMRKICVLEILSARQVKACFAIREEEILNLVEGILSTSPGSAVNLSERLSLLANNIIAKTAIGTECKHRERLVSILKKSEELASGFELVDLYPSLGFMSAFTGISSQLKKNHAEYDKILDQIIEEHCRKREARGTGEEVEDEDLVDVLLSIKEKGGLEFPITNTNIKAVIIVSMYSSFNR